MNMSKMIFVETSTDHLISINVSLGDTIKKVKELIQDKIGVVPHRLIFAEKDLDDEKCLSDYGIPEFSKIYCFSKKLSNLYDDILSIVKQDHDYCSTVTTDGDDIEFIDNTNTSLLDHTYCLVEYVKEEIFENPDARITLQPLVLKKNSSELQNDELFSADRRDENFISDHPDNETSHLSSKPKCTCASVTDDIYSERKPLPTDSLVPEIDWGTITIPDSALSSVEQISSLEEVSKEHAQEKVRGAEIQVSETVPYIDWATITIPDSALSSVKQISGLEAVSQEHAQEKVRGAEIQVSETVPEIDWGTITIPDSALSSVEQIRGLEEVSKEHAQEKVRGAEIQVSETVPYIDWAQIKIPAVATQLTGVLVEEPTEDGALKNVPDAEIHTPNTVDTTEITPKPDEEYKRKLFEHLLNALRLLILDYDRMTSVVETLQETDDVKELKEHLTIIESAIEMHSPVIRYFNIEEEALHSLLIFAEEMLKMSRRLSELRRVTVNIPSEFDIVLKKYQTANKELELSFLNISEYFPSYFDEKESYILLTAESEEITTQTTPGPNVLVQQETVPVQDPVQVEQSDVHQAPDSKNNTKQSTNQKGAGLTRRQMHKMKTSKYLVDCLPKFFIPTYLHVIDFKVTEINRVAADYPSFGILSNRLLPKINDFIIPSSTGNVHVNLHQPKSGLFLSKKQIDDAEILHRVLFEEVLEITSAFTFNPANSNMAFYIVPVLNNNIDWKFFAHHSQQLSELKVQKIPAAIYRIHCLLLAEELRIRISTEMSSSPEPEVLAWPVLDLSKTDALNPTHVPRLPCEDITTNESEILSFCREVDLRSNPGPDPGLVLQALTLEKAKDQINHECLEVIGDSFLEYAIILKLLVKLPEAQTSQIVKSKEDLVKNLTLFNLAQAKGLSAYLVAKPFVESDWIPPCYASDSPNYISEVDLCDKCIADTVQALIGAYLLAWGQRGALLYMQWIGLDPLPIQHTQTPTNTDFSQWPNYAPSLTIGSETPATEEELHLVHNIQSPYNFTNKDILAKLLLRNTYEREYQRMVCLGNTILNYIITRFIFHQQTNLTPGEITRLRAEVTKIKTLALLSLKYKFHKIFVQPDASRTIKTLEESSFFKFFEEKAYISSVLDEPRVPSLTYRILANLFRVFAAAIYIDSNNDLDIVWTFYFPMLKPTLVHYQKKIPVDLTRRVQQLLKKSDIFSQIYQTEDGMWHCQIILPSGILIDEIGHSKKIAKNLAVKAALRELEK